MKYSFLLFSLLFLSGACSSSRNWSGSSSAGGTQATFQELKGKQAFTLVVPDNNTYLKYRFAVNRGILQARIKSPTETVLDKKIYEPAADSIHLVNQKGATYKVYLVGQEADGEFDVKFTTVAKSE